VLRLLAAVVGGKRELETEARSTGSNRHNLTYGEVRSGHRAVPVRCIHGVRAQVLPSSVADVVIPMMGEITPEDVLIDLGSGTGKICFQLAFQTEARRVRGIEFAKARCEVADSAMKRLRSLEEGSLGELSRHATAWSRRLFHDGDEDGTHDDAEWSAAMAPVLRGASERVVLEQGDFLAADLSDVTMVFLNNAVFEPALMLVSQGPSEGFVHKAHARDPQRLLEKLATGCPKLRRVVCLRKLCPRHGRLCEVRGAPCCAFGIPVDVRAIAPTWCDETTLFAYNVSHGSPCSPTSESVAPEAAPVWGRARTPPASESAAPRTPPRAAPVGGRARTPPTRE
jgi:hypothetical protein